MGSAVPVTASGDNFRAVFLGPPGAGKGTQAARLVDQGGALHLSTGEMLREHIRAGTELGEKAKSFMDAGQLVPDDLIIAMAEERLERPDANGSWIMDGFPRTLPQAEALERSLRAGAAQQTAERSLTHVVFFAVPSEVLVARLSSRSTCTECGAIWNKLSKAPAAEGVCDDCGGSLRQREDDRPEAVTKRLEVYLSQTEPLLGYYRSKDCLEEIDADRSPETVFEDLVCVLNRGGS